MVFPLLLLIRLKVLKLSGWVVVVVVDWLMCRAFVGRWRWIFYHDLPSLALRYYFRRLVCRPSSTLLHLHEAAPPRFFPCNTPAITRSTVSVSWDWSENRARAPPPPLSLSLSRSVQFTPACRYSHPTKATKIWYFLTSPLLHQCTRFPLITNLFHAFFFGSS